MALVAIAFVSFTRWQIDGAVVPWDSKNQFYAMFRFLGDALHGGTIPLWNPYQFGGYPAIADPQSLIFTPTMFLFALVAPQASMQLFDAVVLAHLLGGGIGMLGLARRWGWQPVAGILAALVFMMGGSAAARLQHTGMIISYAWFPLALWALEAALERRSMRIAIVAGLLATLMALGRDQVAFLLCFALIGAAVRCASGSGEPLFAFFRTRWHGIAAAAVTTIATMLVPVLLTAQFLHTSNRPGIAFGVALEGSLDPVNLLTLVAPNVFGSLDRFEDYWGPGMTTNPGADWTDRTIDYLYVGALPLVLIVWHGIIGRRLTERGARYFAFLCTASLVYALGRHTPLFSAIFDWMPGVRLYRRPADATFVLNVAFAFAAGCLLDRFIRDGLPDMRFARAGLPALLVGIAALFVVSSGLLFARKFGHFDLSGRYLLASTLVLAFAAFGLFAFRAEPYRSQVALAVVAATAGQLLWYNSASPLNAEPAKVYSAYKLHPDQARGLALLRQEITARNAKGEYPRVEALGIDGSWQNAPMVFKLQDTVGYNPLRIADYESAVGVAENAADPSLREFPDTFRGYNSKLARLLGLDYLILGRPIEKLPPSFPRPHGTLMFAGENFFIYRLDNKSTPRAYVATRVRAVDFQAIIENGTIPSFDVPSEALVDHRDAPALPRTASPAAPGDQTTASIVAYTPNRVELTVDGAGGLLVLHDIDFPGWNVKVDGQRKTLVRANLLFRGVVVPPGHHTVEFVFQPLSPRSLLLAAASLLPKAE